MPDRVGEGQLLGCRSSEERANLFAGLFMAYRDRLESMVRLRLDRRLWRRVDPSDVLQEAYIEASRRLDTYVDSRLPMPLFLWLRRLTAQKIIEVHRFHLDARKRGALREVSIDRGGTPPPSSEALAVELIGRGKSPSSVVAQREMRVRIQEALDRMEPIDREILALRHFEQLSSAEAGRALGIPAATARMRYLRALRRLRDIMAREGAEG
jgi:RNA polymerase sigma-70 factor (ECF subfamily)